MQKRLLIASESSCLAEKRELPEDKNNDNMETCIEYKINYKFVRNKETEIVGNNIKTPYVENLHQKISKINFREIFTINEMIITQKINWLLNIPTLKLIVMKIIAYLLMAAILRMLITRAQ